MNRKWIITIIVVVCVVLLGAFVWMLGQDSKQEESNQKQGNSTKQTEKGPENALTLEKDIEEQKHIQQISKEKEKQEEQNKKKDDKKNKGKNDKNKGEHESDKEKPVDSSKKKEIKKDLTQKAKYILTIIYKPSSEQEKDSTQAKLKDFATNDFIDTYINNDDKNAKDKLIEFKNVNLTLDDENKLNGNEVEGTIVYDQIVKPKNGNDDVKPSVQVNTKMKLWFKKDKGEFKVDKINN